MSWAIRGNRLRAAPAAVLLSLGLLLSACGDESSKGPPPPPVAVIPKDAMGHYCGMFLFEHKGPKGQILLRDGDQPVWFTTIREVFAYTHLPEEPKAVAATYVQDMTRMLPNQTFPPDSWIDAHKAWFLIQSDFIGGMGVPDALPFSDKAAAEAYRAQHGGRVLAFQDVPQDYIFGPGEPIPDMQPGATSPAGGTQ